MAFPGRKLKAGPGSACNNKPKEPRELGAHFRLRVEPGGNRDGRTGLLGQPGILRIKGIGTKSESPSGTERVCTTTSEKKQRCFLKARLSRASGLGREGLVAGCFGVLRAHPERLPKV